MKYLILFDIDGTLLLMKSKVSRKLFADMIIKVFGKEIPITAMPDFAGMTDLQILKEIAEKIGIKTEELHRSLEDIWNSLLEDFLPYCTSDYIDLLPGVKELIHRLSVNADVQLGLLTGNFKDHAYLKLKAHLLDVFFPIGAFGNDHWDRNTLPPIALERANNFAGNILFTNNNTIIIGDTPRDIECAKKNNIPSLAVATGSFSLEKLAGLNPEAVLNDFSNTSYVINSIFNILNKN